MAEPKTLSLTDLKTRYGLDPLYLSGLIDGLALKTYHGQRGSKRIAESDLPKVEKALARVGKLTAAKAN
ncbi:MAG: hypothetical protein P4L84_11290 [Isosphaeraceae bacterium]|nr:hypothetical protein [Isosphaeraceae bacterium]